MQNFYNGYIVVFILIIMSCNPSTEELIDETINLPFAKSEMCYDPDEPYEIFKNPKNSYSNN